MTNKEIFMEVFGKNPENLKRKASTIEWWDQEFIGLPDCADAIRFCKWVAEEIFDENWEYNQDAFTEIACRKLSKMGIVKLISEKWELVESEDNNDQS